MTRPSWIRLLTLVTVALVLAAAPAFAQDDAFKAAMQARERKPPDWRQVEALMRKAIAADPNDSGRIVGRNVFGMGGDPYLPNFFLGEALFQLGQCAEALGAWETSERTGVVAKRAELLKMLQSGYAQCEARGILPAAKLVAALQATEETIRTAAAAAEDARTYGDAHADVWNATTDLRTRNQQAANDLAQARSLVTSGRLSRRAQDLENARKLSASAEKLFRSVRTETERRVKEAAGASSAFDQAWQAASGKASTLAAAINQAGAPPWRVSDTAVTDDHRRAGQLLAEAQTRVGANRSPQTLAEGERSVREAERLLTGATARLEDLVRAASARELQALKTSGPAQLNAAQESLEAIAKAIVDKPPAPDVVAKIQPEIDRSRRELERAPARLADAIAKSDLVEAQSAVRVAANVRRRLENVAKLLGPLDGVLSSFTVPDALRNGAQLFFDARYQDAVGALTDEVASSAEPVHRLHVLTLRSAALFALYEYGGRKDESLMTRARQDARAARALDPAFSPNAAAFSPRFIAFFQASDRTGG